MRTFALTLPALFLVTLAPPLAAKPCAPPPAERVVVASTAPADEEVKRILDQGNLVRSNVTLGGKRFGRAETVVRASREGVLEQVQAYGQYKDLSSNDRFRTSRIIARTEATTDVYMQVSVLKGFLTIWQVMRFTQPRLIAQQTYGIDGTYIKGNLSGARAVFVVREVSPDTCVLRMDLLIELPVPAPQDAIDEELRDASADAIQGLREKAQKAHATAKAR
jgi:hypothetical protein